MPVRSPETIDAIRAFYESTDTPLRVLTTLFSITRTELLPWPGSTGWIGRTDTQAAMTPPERVAAVRAAEVAREVELHGDAGDDVSSFGSAASWSRARRPLPRRRGPLYPRRPAGEGGAGAKACRRTAKAGCPASCSILNSIQLAALLASQHRWPIATAVRGPEGGCALGASEMARPAEGL